MKFSLYFLAVSGFLVLQPVQAKSFYGLFGDITVKDRADQSLDENSVSAVLDFYLAHEFNQKASALLEFVYDDSISHVEKHVERFSLKYEFDPGFYLAVGRFHTPIGNINRTQHHGALLRDTISRPFFLEYHETKVLFPLHVVGLMAGGQFSAESLTIGYESTVHSSQMIETETNHEGLRHLEIDANDSLTGSITPGFALRLRVFPDSKNWQIAGFIYQNEAEFGTANRLDEGIIGVDFEYLYGDWKFNAELFEIVHQVNASDKDYSATAYFLQAGYRLNEVTSVHYRFAEMEVDQNDPYYAWTTLQQQHHHTLALRYDLNEKHALKFELEHQDFANAGSASQRFVSAQWSFLFQ